jgi:tetratricopeptide (TPR) repeat protein
MGTWTAMLLVAAAPIPAGAQAAPVGQEELTPAKRYYLAGVELLSSSRYLDAVEQFQLALDKDPEYIDAYRRLAYVYTQMGRTEADFYQDALDTYERLQEKLPPDDVDVRKNIAFVHAAMGNMDTAIVTYQEILAITPQDCAIWTKIGEAQKLMADRAKAEGAAADAPEVTARLQKAVDAYTKVTELCPDSTQAYNNLGEIHFSANRFTEAGEVYEKLLTKDPKNVDVASRLGYLYRKGEQWEKACAAYKKLLDVEPGRAQDRLLYADALQKSKKFVEATAQYQMLIDADPEKNANLYCNMAMLYALDVKDATKAIDTAMKGISVNAPVQPCLTYAWGKGLELRAFNLVNTGDYDRAISTYREAKIKFSNILSDPNFGPPAKKQLERLDQLITIAEQTREKAKESK